MAKRILLIGAAVFGLLLLLAGAPWQAWAQTTIRNITILGGRSTPADNASNPTDAVTVNALLSCWDAAGSNWDRCLSTTDATPIATATSGAGANTHYTTSAATTNSTSVKGSAGNIYLISAINTTGTLYYLRLYNLSSAPTCSSATGFIETIPVPASTTGAGVVRPSLVGKSFTTGIGFCLTGGGSSTDNTNAATGVYVTIEYE